MKETIAHSAARKTAILLLSLDQHTAAEVLGKLSREHVERITLAIANISNVSRDEQESVLTEFKSAFENRPLMFSAGPEAARQLLELTIDQDLESSEQERLEHEGQTGPFSFLARRHPDDIRLLIQSEHPQTASVVLSQLPAELTSQVLSGFDSATRNDILRRIASLGAMDVDIVAEIASTFQRRIGNESVRVDGVKQTAQVIRQSNQEAGTSFLKELTRSDAGLAQSIRESVFSFRDLEAVDDSTLKCILSESDQFQWAIALKGCSEKLRQRILSLLGPSVALALKSEMTTLGPLRLSEILSIQKQISQVILDLATQGRIDLLAQKKSSWPRTG